MKKLFTLFFSLLLAGIFTTTSAQQNIFVWKDGGNLSVISSEDVDSVSFSAGSWLFKISTSTAVSVTANSFKAMASVSLNENVKSLSVSPEVGVCYSDENSQPTYSDAHDVLGSSMTDYTININYIDPGTTYYYRTYVKLLGEVYYDPNVYSITTLGAKPTYYTIVNGHKFVDLGLPSGLLWARNNVGASTPYADGDYYAWGETETKSSYSWSTYKWGSSPTKYNSSDGKTMLEASDDVATVKWGKECRMPSRAEFQELYNKCDWTWKSSYNGASGYLVTGPSGQTIFLPASGSRYDGDLYSHGSGGSYWSSSFYAYTNSAYGLDFVGDGIGPSCNYGRCMGLSVRPVAEK